MRPAGGRTAGYTAGCPASDLTRGDGSNRYAGFQVEVYLPRPARPTPNSASQKLILLKDALLTVVGKGVHSSEGLRRISTLQSAFQGAVYKLTSHEMSLLMCGGGARRRELQHRLVLLVNDGLSKWASALFDAAVSAGQRWSSPPDVANFPPVVVLAWESLDAYIALGRLGNGEFHSS